MSPLPEHYPSPLHLPFNSTALERDFVPAPADADPGGPGFSILLRGGELLVEADGEGFRLPAGPLPPCGEDAPLYIGRWQGRPCRALAWPKEREVPQGLVAESLLASEPRLSIELLSLGGRAGQTLHWEKNSRHCSRCGGGMAPLPGEWGKKCSTCGYAHFPHIHPCVIVLVRRGDELLLTRKAEWPQGRYSLVAGFVDFGESFEEAVVREVREETGIEVREVLYIGSQCWPFPSQVMAGFVAEYAGGEVVVEEKELEDARWFKADALPQLPPRRSIARYIIDRALAGEGT